MTAQAYGFGGIYQRGGVWWIRYSFRGEKRRESSHSTSRKVASDLLKRRLAEIGRGGRLIGPRAERVTVAELADSLFKDYRLHGARAVKSAESVWDNHLEPFFRDRLACTVTAAAVREYIEQRQREGAAPASINYSLRLLHRMFTLAVEDDVLDRAHVPHVPTLAVENARKGFFERKDFEKVAAILKAPLADAARFAYLTGWRKSEVTGLLWREVSLAERTARLSPERSKTKDGRTIGLTGELLTVLQRRHAERRLDCPHVFHEDGRSIGDFRKAWATACKTAGVTGRLFHDLRRTAVRNLVRAGVAEHTAMKVTGHKTRAVFDRYDIVDRRDTARALERVQEYLATDTEAPAAVTALPDERARADAS